MAQLLTPTSDQATGSWTNPPLWSKANSDDGTDAVSEAVGNNTQTSSADLKLASGSDPQAGTQTLRARWHHDQNNRSMQTTCELYQGDPAAGGSLIATLQSASNVGTTEVEDSTTVSGITDYTDLYVRLYGFSNGGGPSRSLHVDLVELSLPDAGAAAKEATGSSSLALTSGSAATQRTAKATGTSGVALTTPSASAKATRKATGSSSLAATTTGSGKKTGKATGTSSLALTSSGSGSIAGQTKTATGTSSLSLSSSGTPQRTAKGSGTSSVALTSTATPQRTAVASGSSSLTLTVTGAPHRTAKGVGSSALVISASGATHRTAKATGSSALMLTSSGQGDNASVESTFGDLRTVQVNYQGIW